MSNKEIMTLVERSRKQIAAALPEGVNEDRVIRMARTVVNTTPILAKCTPRSILGAVIECAQLGLEPGITAHLVPFKGKATMIADYRGLMQLAYRSGKVVSIMADVIRENDKFSYSRGTNAHLMHEPVLGNEGPVIAAYAVANLADGHSTFEVVSRRDLDKLADSILARQKSGPWKTDWDAMAKKTAVRRLCKFLPFSTESVDLQRAIVLDEAADRGEQNLGVTLDGDFELEPKEPESPMSDEQRDALEQEIDKAKAQ